MYDAGAIGELIAFLRNKKIDDALLLKQATDLKYVGGDPEEHRIFNLQESTFRHVSVAPVEPEDDGDLGIERGRSPTSADLSLEAVLDAPIFLALDPADEAAYGSSAARASFRAEYIVSISQKARLCRLHCYGFCFLEPGIDYKEYERVSASPLEVLFHGVCEAAGMARPGSYR